MYFSLLQGHDTSLCAGGQRRAHAMDARHHALLAFVDFLEHALADAGHDAHADDDVGRIGQLHADLRHGAADGAHAEGQHVHGAALHAAAEQLLEFLAHLKRVDPIVGGAGAVFRERTNEGAVFDAGDIVGVGPGVEAARPEILVELGEGAGVDQLLAQIVVFFLRTIDPMNGSRLGEGRHLVNPIEKMRILAQGLSRGSSTCLHNQLFSHTVQRGAYLEGHLVLERFDLSTIHAVDNQQIAPGTEVAAAVAVLDDGIGLGRARSPGALKFL